MKRFLLLGILILTYNLGFAQTILTPSRDPIVCLGGDVKISFNIDETSGSFNVGNEFKVQLSDKDGSFSSPTELGRITYVSGTTFYEDTFVFSGTEVSVSYHARIVSTNPADVTSPESGIIQAVQNDQVVASVVNGDPTEFCDGEMIVLESNLSSGVNLWYNGGSLLSAGQTIEVKVSGDYYVVNQIGNSCESTSEIITVNVTSLPVSDILEGDTNICLSDGPFTFNANSSNTDAPFYEWYESSNPTNILHSGGVGVGDKFSTDVAGFYILRTSNYGGMSTGGGCPDISDPVELIVHDYVAVIDREVDSPIKGCEGTGETLTSSETNPSYIYRWFKNNVEITGLIQPATSISVDGVIASNGTYRLEIESPGCTKVSGDVEITFILTPVSQITPNTNQDICKGEIFTLTENSNNKFGITTYQWLKDGEYIPSATNSTYDAFETGVYTLRTINDNTCSDISDPVTIAVHDFVSEIIITQGAADVCEGTVLELESSETNPTYTYIWKKGTVIVSQGLNKTVYSVPSVEASSGSYTLTIVSGICAVKTSTTVDINIKPVPVFDIGVDRKGCLNDGIILTSTLNNTEYTYTWYKDNVLAPGVNGLPSYIFSLDAITEGVYRLDMSFAGDCIVSSEIIVSLVDAPTSVVDPAIEAIACEGSKATLTALSTGVDLTYQWYKGGVAIPGATSITYEAPTTHTSYSLETTSEGTCSTMSSDVSVIISKPAVPVITAVPADFKHCTSVQLDASSSDLKGEAAGRVKYNWYDENDNFIISGVTLDVTSSGVYKLEALNYELCGGITQQTVIIHSFESVIEGDNVQCIGDAYTLSSQDVDAGFKYTWYNGSVDPLNVVGGNNPVLSLNGDASNAGDYILVVDGYNCSSTSAPFAITMVKTPIAKIKDDGNSYSGCTDVLLESESTELESPTYKWYKDGVEIVEATAISYTATESSAYYLEVFNSGKCSSISPSVDVHIDNLSAEIDQTGITEECVGHNIILKAIETNPNYIYTWIVDGVDIANSNNPTYTVVADVAKIQTYTLRVKSNESNCEKTSLTPIDVEIKAAPVANILFKEGLNKGCFGDIVTLMSGGTIDLAYTYVWSKNGVPIDGANGLELEVAITEDVDVKYSLSIAYSSCYDTSDEVSVHKVKTPESIIDPSDEQIVCDDATVILTASSINLENPKYQWYKDGAPQMGHTASTYKVIETGYYSLLTINDGLCDNASDPVHVIITPTAIAKITPNTDQEVCEEVTLKSISENVDGNNPQYQWYHNDAAIPNATGTSLVATVVGDYYLEVFNHGICGTKSGVVNVTLTKFEHQIDSDPLIVECNGHDVRLESINKDVGYTFHWFKQGESFALKSGPEYWFDVIGSVSNSGFYFLKVVKDGADCDKDSELVEVRIKPEPESKINLGTGTNCEGKAIGIAATISDADYDYSWYFNGVLLTEADEVSSGGNYHDVHTSPLVVNMYKETEGEYQVKVSVGNCDAGLSNKAVLIMDDIEPEIDSYPSEVLCPDGSITLTATAIGSGFDFAWYKDGEVIADANSNTYLATEIGIYKAQVTSADNGCTQTTDEIEIIPSTAVMGVEEDIIEVDFGQTATFKAFGGFRYEWYYDGELVQDGGDTFDVLVEENTMYQVKIISEFFCEELIELQVIIEELTSHNVQNLITPNGDGKNDVWVLPNGISFASDVEVTVLNRQGLIIFQTFNYQNNWGGTLNGSLLPGAAYYYVIKRNGKDPIMGSITIFR